METATDFGRYWEALTSTLGSAGAIAAIAVVLAVGPALLMWRLGPPMLLWAYLFLTMISTGAQSAEWRAPIIPPTVASVGAALRWFVLFLLAALGVGYLATGRVRMNATIVLLFALVIAAIFSAVASGETGPALQRAIVLGLLLCSALVVHRCVSSWAGLVQFMRTYLGLGVVVVLMVLAAIALRPGLVFAGSRFRGFADNANMMGMICITFMIPAAWLAFDPRSRGKAKTFGLVLLAFFAGCLVLTGSRASMLSTLPILAAIAKLGGKRIGLWLGGAVLLGIVAIVAVQFMGEKLTSHMFGGESSERLDHTLYGLSVMAERPLFGYGYGYSALYVRSPGTNLNLHNGYIVLGIDLGILGLGCMLAIAFTAIRNAFAVDKLCRRSGFPSAAPLLLGALVAGFLVNALFEGWFTGVGSAQLYMFMLALGALSALRGGLEQELRAYMEYRQRWAQAQRQRARAVARAAAPPSTAPAG